MDVQEMLPQFRRHLTCPVLRAERLGGGNNSQVYRLVCEDGADCVAKVYFHHRTDPRNRRATEFDGLSFLWNHGIRRIPRPLATDPDAGFSLYEFLPGERVDSGLVTEDDIRQCTDFLTALEPLKTRPRSETLPAASEAYFSVREILANLDRRIERIRGVPEEGILVPELRAFLNGEFFPLVDEIRAWIESRYREAGLTLDWVLPVEDRTLSPSDFGFHNSIRRADGSLAFVDFEYFGWDDPAKMIVDFIHHPGMNTPAEQKRQYYTSLSDYFGRSGLWPLRLSAAYPLFGLKWTLIILNEFVPADLARRSFAAASPVDVEQRRVAQLEKARRMVRAVQAVYREGLFAGGLPSA